MTIVLSEYEIGHLQVDGRRYVRESHTDSQGVVRPLEYGPVVALDYQVVADARARRIEEQLATEEFEGAINGS